MRFIVNEGGTVHPIPEGWPMPHGAREATPEEVRDWYLAQGLTPPEEARDAQAEHAGPDSGDKKLHRRRRA